MFRGIIRPIIRPILDPKIIKKRLNSGEFESKIPCDKIYHSEEYKKINEKLKEINSEATLASFNAALCLIVLLIKN